MRGIVVALLLGVLIAGAGFAALSWWAGTRMRLNVSPAAVQEETQRGSATE